MKQTIGILGCGWLGLPLAKSFLEKGYLVHGTTTTKNKIQVLKKEGIVPFLLQLGTEQSVDILSQFLDNVSILIINVPPKLKSDANTNYFDRMVEVHQAIKKSKTQKVIFVSSTSVYGAVNGKITEETVPCPVTESAKQLIQSENLFKNNTAIATTIIRFGGLIGLNRHPIKYLSGKTGLKNGKQSVNLIHLEDCIGVIHYIVHNENWNIVVNGVYPHHPLKKDYYTKVAQELGLPLPLYDEDNEEQQKIITSKYFSDANTYHFKVEI